MDSKVSNSLPRRLTTPASNQGFSPRMDRELTPRLARAETTGRERLQLRRKHRFNLSHKSTRSSGSRSSRNRLSSQQSERINLSQRERSSLSSRAFSRALSCSWEERTLTCGYRTQLSLATLPPASLQRYLSRYGLLEAQGSLSYHHAVFPVPALPAVLPPPLIGRTLVNRRSSKPRIDPVLNGEEGPAPGEGEASNDAPMEEVQPVEEVQLMTGRGRKRVWQEPKTPEFANLSAYDDPQLVVDRLAARAKAHWDKRDSVKEG